MLNRSRILSSTALPVVLMLSVSAWLVPGSGRYQEQDAADHDGEETTHCKRTGKAMTHCDRADCGVHRQCESVQCQACDWNDGGSGLISNTTSQKTLQQNSQCTVDEEHRCETRPHALAQVHHFSALFPPPRAGDPHGYSLLAEK